MRPRVIVLAVRWYRRFALSSRDVEELLAEGGIEVDHVTIYRLYRLVEDEHGRVVGTGGPHDRVQRVPARDPPIPS
jgi:hypothetical protein